MNKKNNIHLYKQIENDIKKNIQSGKYDIGDKIGTEQVLSKKYNVSRATIRRALKELEEEGFIDRLLSKGTFVKAKNKNTNKIKNKTIAVIVPVVSQDFIGDIITGTQQVTNDNDYNINLFITNNSIEKEKEYLKKVYEDNVAGIILHPTNSKYYNRAVCDIIGDIPLIMTARYYEHFECDYVVPDNYRGGYIATEHLIKLGHKNIGIVSDRPLIQTSIKDRINGYKDSLSDNDICVNKNYMLDNLCDPCMLYSPTATIDEQESTKEKIINFLKRIENEVTAIFAINDFIGRELIMLAKELNINIPSDISIVGFDNVILSKKTDPSLTTINWSQMDVGKKAANLLINKIENKREKRIQKVLSVELVKRNSTTQYTRE